MHIMVDLETLGTGQQAPIIAIGAVAFLKSGVIETFYQNVDFYSAVKNGEVDGDTLRFWFNQTDDARLKFFSDPAPRSLEEVLKSFSYFIETHRDMSGTLSGVWGNGATFDNVILDSAYKATKVEKPWSFWQDRCYRTMKNEFKEVPFERVGTHHNALDDAKSQALHLIEIWEHIDDKIKQS